VLARDPAVGGSPVGIVRVFLQRRARAHAGREPGVVKTAAGDTMTSYPVSPLPMSPGSAVNPMTGTTELAGDQSGLDPSLRPMWPALFITDITTDPNSASAIAAGRPAARPERRLRKLEGGDSHRRQDRDPEQGHHHAEANPAKNHWDLAGGDPVPAGLTDQGFGAEARWDVPLVAGHSYRCRSSCTTRSDQGRRRLRARPASSSARAVSVAPAAAAATCPRRRCVRRA